jgi:hypothetical protein
MPRSQTPPIGCPVRKGSNVSCSGPPLATGTRITSAIWLLTGYRTELLGLWRQRPSGWQSRYRVPCPAPGARSGLCLLRRAPPMKEAYLLTR